MWARAVEEFWAVVDDKDVVEEDVEDELIDVRPTLLPPQSSSYNFE